MYPCIKTSVREVSQNWNFIKIRVPAISIIGMGKFCNFKKLCWLDIQTAKKWSKNIQNTKFFFKKHSKLITETDYFKFFLWKSKISFKNWIKCDLLIKNFWIKWGVVRENLTSSCQAMPQKPYWAHLAQIYKLVSSPHVRLNYQEDNFINSW